MNGSISGQKTFIDGIYAENITSVNLPEIAPSTQTVKLAGGEVEIPTSLYGPMETTINFRGIDSQTANLWATGEHKIEVRYAQQQFDDGSTKVTETAVKEFMDVISKGKTTGDVEPGTPQENSATFEVLRYRKIHDGKEIFLIDKRTGKVFVNGKEVTAERSNILD